MKGTPLAGVGSVARDIIEGRVAPFKADATEPITVERYNGSGVDMAVGDVAVLLPGGTIELADVAQDTRLLGVCVDAIADGELGQVQYRGPVPRINVTASVSAGDYAESTTTPGQATGNATRQAGSFAQFTSGGTTPSGFLFGVPDNGAGGGGGGSGVDAGTSNPGSPSTGDQFFRTDLGLYIYYDGTRWLSTQLFELAFGVGDNVNPSTATATPHRQTVPYVGGASDLWLVAATFATFSVGNTGSAYWTLDVSKYTGANTGTVIATRNTSGDTASNWARAEVAIGAALGGAATYKELQASVTKVGAPVSVYLTATMTYRLIVT